MMERDGDGRPRGGSHAPERPSPDADEADSVLDDLVEVERRVDETVRRAEAEAARAIAEAEAEIERHGQANDQELESALRELEASLRAEQVKTLDEIRRQGEAEARRYREIDDARVDALAERIARRVAEGGPADDEAAP